MNTNGIIVPWEKTEAGQRIQARLAEEQTLSAIDHLLSRIDTLEKAVDSLATVMQRAPGLMSMTADMADEAVRQAEAQGVSIDERLRVALAMAEKLTAPAMLEKLDSLLTLADRAPGIAAMTIDMADDVVRSAHENGVDINERLGTALQLAERLTAPAMVEKLDAALKFADQMPGLMAMGIDTFDELMQRANDSGFDPTALVDLASNANRAFLAARAEPPAKVGGIFGLLRVWKDPDRQRAVGFFMNFFKHFGKNI